MLPAVAETLGARRGLFLPLDAIAGMSLPPALLFLAAAMVLLIKALHADILNTRVEREVRRLNQRLALLELDHSTAQSQQTSQ